MSGYTTVRKGAANGAGEAPQHEVAIIGAGLSGIGMAIALRRAGIEDFVILERAGDVGGTWRDNTYPGIGVDIPAQAYQFSYELKPDWSGVYATGAEVKAYVDQLVEHHGVRPFVRFHSEVTERVWDAEQQLWRLKLSGGEVTARFVIGAIGPFVDPKPAEIPGLDDFRGKVIQSARWDHDYDLAGKRAAIVGTGASAVQIIPEIAKVVGHLDVYQRTPIWVAPKFNPRTPERVKALYRRVPALQNLVRATATGGAEFVLIFMVVNHRRVPFVARKIASLHERFYRSQVPDPELRRKLTPSYGFGCKRPAVSNTYLRAFTRDNVELVTDSIERVTATGVETVDGRRRDVDVLILATGFRLASDPENFRRTPVRGRGGFDLATFYAEHRLQSYEGVSVPGLPNHFMMFGPYGWTGGTWHTLVETTSAHIVRVIREARRRGALEVEVRQEATDRWTDFVRRRLSNSLWRYNNCAPANSYYFDHHGDTPFLRPTSSLQARRAARKFPFEDYRFRSPSRS
ncbi:MAG: putative monooxygenase [Solirubrobacterales bacterium]|nr:putative monooxygenase [Solirubrobacterales bacterium]